MGTRVVLLLPVYQALSIVEDDHASYDMGISEHDEAQRQPRVLLRWVLRVSVLPR